MIKLMLFFSILFCQFNSTIGNNFSSQSYSSKGATNQNKINEEYIKRDDKKLIDLKAPGESFIKSGKDVFIESDYDYSQFTSFNMQTYFEHLDLYSAWNHYDSCGFVSLIQILSYYDTFYNDGIIPEQYEGHKTYCRTEEEAILESPGVRNHSPYNYVDTLNTANYWYYCHAAFSEDFQCALTCVYNQVVLHTDDTWDFESKIHCQYYQELLDAIYGYGMCEVSWNHYSHSRANQQLAKLKIKSYLDQGIPVVAHIEGVEEEDDKYHSIVIYDYEQNDFYGHFGNANNDMMLSRVNVLSVYKYITEVAVLDFSNVGHKHSDNYFIDGKGYCGCNLCDRVEIASDKIYLNCSPTFYWMKNNDDPFEMYELTFVSDLSNEPLYQCSLSGNSLILSNTTWRNLCENMNYRYTVTLQRLSSYGPNRPETTTFNKPYRLLESFRIEPSDYGFADAYPTDSITQNEYLTHNVNGWITFRTRRYRTGYIQQEAIVMSCIKRGINEAFIEYSFDVGIVSMEVELSHWREYSSEHLDKNSGIAELQIWDSNDIYGNWIRKMDLLSNDTNLPRDRNHPTTYTIVFDQPVYGFRFYERINNMENSSSNKGRICIGDIKLYFEN